MSTPAGAPAPVFSYAQAAKGLTSAISTQTTSRNQSPTLSEKDSKVRPVSDFTTATSSALKSPRLGAIDDGSGGEGASTKALPKKDISKDSAPHSQSLHSNSHPDASITWQNDASSSAPAQESHKDEPAADLPNGGPPSSADAPDAASDDKAAQNAADKKSKDAEDDWEKVSVPSTTADTQFKDAPVPTVNFWQQRQEAQAAKWKEFAAQPRVTPASTAMQSPKSNPANEDFKRKPTSKEAVNGNREGKSAEGTRPNHRKEISSSRLSRPGSQLDEKADAEAPPSVADARSWPTPDTSIADERRKSTTHTQTEKVDARSSTQKSHGNKWSVLPFVPTAKFETQLPPSVSRRGGRGGARGRDAGGRGGHSGVSGEKVDGTTTMGPPPLPKAAADQDRGRRPDGLRGARGASVPTNSTRPTIGEDTSSNFRKHSATYGKEQASTNGPTNVATPGLAGDDQPLMTAQSSRSSSRHTGKVGGRMTNGDVSTPPEQSSTAFGHSSDPNIRYPYNFERLKGATATASRGNSEVGRERGPGRNRDWSRDKPESSREKVESWRDREPSGDQAGRREHRTERGRGGFRGRGNHNFNAPYGSAHAFTSPLPQNGFEPPSRSNSNNESRTRQTPQPFQPNQTAATPRSNPRSNSIPVGMAYPGVYNNGGPAMGPGLPAAIQTDMQMYGYPSPMQMQPGIMSAMPYNDPLNSYALLSMVMTQIEYYFSIDNLCKDLFLRKHMDGQGWVPLSVIANFKRIKTLTEDNMAVETLRYVCQQVKSVEFLPGADGDDLLRRRDGWRDFILPAEDRFESARHDGIVSDPEQQIQQPEQGAPYDPSLGLGPLRSPLSNIPSSTSQFPAGSSMPYLSGPPVESRVPAPPFVRSFGDAGHDEVGGPFMAESTPGPASSLRSPPSQHATALNNIVNGHRRLSSRADIEDSFFPDDQIPNINIRMQPRKTVDQESAHGAVAEALNGPNGATSPPLDAGLPRVPSLRGGAGSPQQLDSAPLPPFGFPIGIPTGIDGTVVYFAKDGPETHLPPPQVGQYDQTYLSLHDVSFQQRRLGVEGALEPLYSFWSDFLVDKFNFGMYQEFRDTAVSDLHEGNSSGLSHLVRYFGKILSGSIPISERLAADMVTMSREETTEGRPLWKSMRTAWRNGATNMKTIKRLGDVLTSEEKAELEKSG